MDTLEPICVGGVDKYIVFNAIGGPAPCWLGKSRLPEEQEQQFMDQLTLDGFLHFEEDRRREWLVLPRETLASIRRLHTMIGHKPKAVMVHIMKGAAVNPEIVKSATYFRCDHCHERHLLHRSEPHLRTASITKSF